MPIVLVATGGTIASTLGPNQRAVSTLSGRELLGFLPDDAASDVEVVDLSVAGSWNLGTDGAVAVAAAIRQAANDGAEGVVVTHGTDVMEETAWVCELLTRSAGIPVVFTGSMRHADDPNYEGPRNLSNALAVARVAPAAARGTMLCMEGDLHAARYVVKTHATAQQTFMSFDRPPVGHVASQVTWTSAAVAAPPLVGEVPAGPVPIVVSHWDADPEPVRRWVDDGVAGLVVEGTGAGNINIHLVAELERAVERGVPVVVATRCRGGAVEPIYGGPGGFGILGDHGLVGSAGLTAGKARLALQLLLGPNPDHATAVATTARWFADLGGLS